MSVRSTVFGAVHLSGAESKKFINQVKHGRPKKAAVNAYKSGKDMVKQMDSQGYVVIERERKTA